MGLGRLCAVLIATLATPCTAWAQTGTGEERSVEATSPEANDFGTVGDESAELRALRVAELELFGDRTRLPPPPSSELRLGELPDALSSRTPAEALEQAEGGPDLSWLRGISLPDIPIRWDEQVIRYLEFYKSDARGRAIMRAWLERQSVYGPMVADQLRELGLPGDLLYVAMIESGFDPTARSHASAVGMWQFVRATGTEYGLTVNHWLDQRMDPVLATNAGARYLRDLHRRFGSWELAFAAYNMGYGALLRAIRKYNTNDYWVLARLEAGLPFETTFYVAKIMACAIVGHNRARFGFEGVPAGTALSFDQVDVPAGTPLARIARAASVDTDTIRSLNPAFRRNRVPPGGPAVSIRIPAGKAAAFARVFRRPRHEAQQPYVVRFGETLRDVARRFGTTRAALRGVNELDQQSRIGVGLRLMVPAGEPRDTEEEPVVVAVPDEAAYPGRRRVFYRVTRGDTANEIARFFRVEADDLRRWNNVETAAALQSGMVLQLFVSPEFDLGRALVLTEDEVRLLVVGSEEFFDYHETQRGRVRFRYTIRSGDTLTSIARRFDLSVASLSRINRFGRRTDIRAGDQMIVYAPRDSAPRGAVREADERMNTLSARWGGNPSEPTPALRDDGDGEAEAADQPATP